MATPAQVLEIERRGAVAWLWLNRPDVRNALDGALTGALDRALVTLGRERSVRALVLGGRGQAFCAGGDLARMEQAAKLSKAAARRDAARFARLLYRLHTLAKPTIARVHGAAFAGGMGLVAACDLVVAAEEAEFCLPEARIGLVPAMISPYLVRVLGAQQARRYVLTGERLPAREALRIGFAHECVPQAELDARVERLAHQLAQAGPRALARSKKLLAKVEHAALGPKLSTYTAQVLAEVRAGEEAREGIRAFLEKRKPRWVG